MELGIMSSERIGNLSAADEATLRPVVEAEESGEKCGLKRVDDDVRVIVGMPNDRPLAEIGRSVPEDEDEENENGTTPLLGPRAEESMAEMEINTLLWLKRPGNAPLKQALESWQAKDALFASRVDQKRKQSSSLRNEVYQLIGFDSVFQGVLLTAVAQSNLLLCRNWWTAFFLSLLASLVTVAGVIQKFRSVVELEETISHEEASRKDCIKRVQKLLRLREKFSLREDAKDNARPVPGQTRLKVYIVLVIAVLLLFSALFLASIIRILCHSGLPECPAAAPSPL